MPNSDRVFHNVFSFHDGKRFDLGLYPVGTRQLVTFDAPGVSRIFCNIHPNMAAYVVAVDSAFFAVTDAEGRFAIAGVEAARTRIARGGPAARPRRAPSRSSRTGRSRSTGHEPGRRSSPSLALAGRGRAGAARPSPSRRSRASACRSERSPPARHTGAACSANCDAGLRFHVEGAWGARSSEGVGRLRHRLSLRRAGADHRGLRRSTCAPQARGVRSMKGGRYRTPFGIYGGQRPRLHRVSCVRR